MSDEQAVTPVFQIQRVYLKDLSLEQPNSPAILLEQEQPSLDIQLAVEATPVADGYSTGVKIVFRALPAMPPVLADLQVEPGILEHAFPSNGLVLVTGVMVTGFASAHGFGSESFMALLHVLFGEAILICLPFTRLSHAILIPFTRAYMGSESIGVRRTCDW